ncbi:hypothetical protein ABT288_32855 [Streptomyces sp. NPDC001093]|uniref:hypothetical protein n=1 Tax=Streptomyces sp. NPDC001093 TaxID=3154376 RepID=UPI0033246CD1
MAELIDRFETGYLSTVITRHDSSYEWTHSGGTDRPRPLAAPSRHLFLAAERAGHDEVRFVTPTSQVLTDGGTALTYRTPGPRSLASMFLSKEDPADAANLLACVARGLSRFHTPLPDGTRPRTPNGIDRVMAWLDNGQGPMAAAAWHTLARQELGMSRWNTLRHWCDLFTRPEAQFVVHGAMGTGMIVPSAENIMRAAVLCGTEEAASLPEFDIGWMLGELHENEHLNGHDPAYVSELQRAFLSSYDRPVDMFTVSIATALRVLIHAHDFAAYMGWSRLMPSYVPLLAELVDSEGACAVTAAASR